MATEVEKSLGKVGLLNRGDYDPGATYNAGDYVLSNRSSWVCKVDGTTGVTPAEGVNWQYLAQGMTSVDGLSLDNGQATDTYGVSIDNPSTKPTTVTTKKLFDGIGNWIANKLVKTDAFQSVLTQYLVNNGATTNTGFALDARFGKTLQDQVTELNSKGQGFFAMDGSLKTLPELIALNGVYMYGAIIWISWDSAIAADANNMICIANANVIWGFSFSGKIFYYNNIMATAEWKEWNPSTV